MWSLIIAALVSTAAAQNGYYRRNYGNQVFGQQTSGNAVPVDGPFVSAFQRPRAYQSPTFGGNGARAFQAPILGGQGGGFGGGPQGPIVQQGVQETPVVLVQQVGPSSPGYVYSPQQQYYPVEGGDSGFWCFTGDTMVKTLTRGQIRMDELTVDDWVMSSDRKQLIYEPVKQWVHRDAEKVAEFHKLELDDGTSLKLSGKHFIYKVPCEGGPVEHNKLVEEPEYAETVEAGDCVYKLGEFGNQFTPTRVTKVSKVVETGIYSPMTVGGDIVVNGIFSSCHSMVKSHPLQETFFKMIDSLNQATRFLFAGQTASEYMADKLELPSGISMAAQLYHLTMGSA